MTERPDPTAPTALTPIAPIPTPDPKDTEPLMTQHDDPTDSIETVHTQAVPQPNPFRVEPATPVPDDVSSERQTTDRAAWAPPASTGPMPVPHEASTPGSSGCSGHHSGRHGSHHAHVTVRKGPRPGAVVLGLLSMIVAAYVIAVNVTDADVEFRIVGPVLIGALGGLLLLVGLAGVVVGRLRR